MAREYKVISGDTHLEINSNRWTNRVPEKYRDRAPRVVRLENGGDGWLIEGQAVREIPFDLYGGKGRATWRPFGQNYESTPGTGSAEQRIREQDDDGLDAEILFPGQVSGPRFWRNIKDDNAYKAVVRAYNDYLLEEYAAVDPDRLLAIGVLPWTGVDDAIAEMEHVASKGAKGVLLGVFPSGKGVPTPEDDRFWKHALDMKMPITIHVDLDRSGPRAGSLLAYPKENKTIRDSVGPLGDVAAQTAKFAQVGSVNAVQMVLDGLFDRFPDLRIFIAETNAGWLPWFLHMADQRFDRHKGWSEELLGWKPYARDVPPSTYIKEHFLWGFQCDPAAVEMRHRIGVENLIWATDFPHQESEYPNSNKVLERNFAGIPEEDRYAMVAGNCIKHFHLPAITPAQKGVKEAVTA
jgi:predicted TIM-barrel fold metal-dependent hydrolase